MSRYRENVIWPSPDGTFSIGFYVLIPAWFEGADEEWDVEFDFSAFEWASTGHPDPASALNAWKGANPGCHHTIPERTTANEAECAHLDAMARTYLDARRSPALTF
jgi:hypothetical protein